jgi:predicted RNA-binding protein with PIN domain
MRWRNLRATQRIARLRIHEPLAMRIVIDGYNLLKAMPEYRHRDDLDLERARDQLIALLGRYRWLKGHQVTVVFDGWIDGDLLPRRLNTRGVQVIYSQRGEQADDVIRRVAPQVAHQGVVITSDRALAQHMQRLGAEVVGSAEFAERLHAALFEGEKGRTDDLQEAYVPPGQPHQKGAARRASRAERRRERKLRNL